LLVIMLLQILYAVNNIPIRVAIRALFPTLRGRTKGGSNPRNPRPRYRETRPFVLSIRDRILMLFVWLRTYPTFARLGSMFGVSESTAL
jgi:hypothetical protein